MIRFLPVAKNTGGKAWENLRKPKILQAIENITKHNISQAIENLTKPHISQAKQGRPQQQKAICPASGIEVVGWTP